MMSSSSSSTPLPLPLQLPLVSKVETDVNVDDDVDVDDDDEATMRNNNNNIANDNSINTAIVVESMTTSRFSVWKQLVGRTLERYTRIVGDSVHRDRLLKTLQWTMWWYSQMGKSKAAATFYNEVCWARYVSRLTECPTAIEALWNDSWTVDFGGGGGGVGVCNGNSDRDGLFLRALGRTLGRIMAASMFVFYPAEHAAYGRWRVIPQRHGQRFAEMYSAWSCRAWLLYILTDIVQGYVALTTTPTLSNEEEQTKEQDDDVLQASKRRRHKQQVIMLRNILFLLPAYHWSLPDWDRRPWLKSTTVNLFMWLEAIVSLYQTSLEVE